MKRMFATEKEDTTFKKVLKGVGVALVFSFLLFGFDEGIHLGVSCSIHSNVSGDKGNGFP